jgi:hypothetical protein
MFGASGAECRERLDNNKMQLTSGGLLAGASRPLSLSRRLQLILVFCGPERSSAIGRGLAT